MVNSDDLNGEFVALCFAIIEARLEIKNAIMQKRGASLALAFWEKELARLLKEKNEEEKV